jgi:hypothetical protein
MSPGDADVRAVSTAVVVRPESAPAPVVSAPTNAVSTPKSRFGKIRSRRFRTLVAKFAADLDPLNVLDEVALLRALTMQFIDEHEERVVALMTWHAQGKRAAITVTEEAALRRMLAVAPYATDQEKKDHATVTAWMEVLVLARQTRPMGGSPNVAVEAAELVDVIGRMVERIEKARGMNAISESELSKLMSAMGRAVDVLVSDQGLKDRIKDAWLRLVTK